VLPAALPSARPQPTPCTLSLFRVSDGS
jgi:hypothetical protein